LIAEWAGGRAARGAVDTDPSEPVARRVAFRPARVARLLGAEIAADEQRALLRRVEVETEPAAAATVIPVAPEELVPVGDAEAWLAVVPGHRRDIAIEADVAEEVARVRGYETVPPRRPDTLAPPYRSDPRALVDAVRDLLASRGLSEVVGHALVAPFDNERVGGNGAGGESATLEVANPVSADHSELRRSLLPGLLRIAAENERQRRRDIALFEIGAVHRWDGAEPAQDLRLGLLLAGEWQLPGWDQPARDADLGDIKGLVEWLGQRLHLPALGYEPLEARPGVDHPGRVAALTFASGAENRHLGRVAELHPELHEAYDLRATRVAFAEIDLEPFLAAAQPLRRVVPPSRFPVVERDIAVVVGEGTPAGRLSETIRVAAGPLLRDLRLFDRYEGPPLDPGEQSLAYRLRIGSSERTLTDSEVDALMASVVDALQTTVGARIRD
jgi:phenylalanyl-tRNA synthetase beta chain